MRGRPFCDHCSPQSAVHLPATTSADPLTKAGSPEARGKGRLNGLPFGFGQGGMIMVGHLGLTPQRASMLIGFKAQGKDALMAKRIIDDARVQISGAPTLRMMIFARLIYPSPIQEVPTSSVFVSQERT